MLDMQFEYFRFLLTPLQQASMLTPSRPKSREELIKDIFSKDKEYVFKSGRAQYGFVINYNQNGLVRAKMGRQTKKKISRSPKEKFATENVDDWPNCPVFINISDERNSGRTLEAGQVIAFGLNFQAINNPKNCLRAFADKINTSLTHDGYFLTINPIPSERKKFWTVAKEYEGQIRKLVLFYTPPNLFNIDNSLNNDLREVNKEFNTTSAQIVFENEAGSLILPENNELLKQTAEHIDSGNGRYTFHLTKGKKTIKSDGGIKKETFDGLELFLEGSDPKGIEEAINAVLGKKNA